MSAELVERLSKYGNNVGIGERILHQGFFLPSIRVITVAPEYVDLRKWNQSVIAYQLVVPSGLQEEVRTRQVRKSHQVVNPNRRLRRTYYKIPSAFCAVIFALVFASLWKDPVSEQSVQWTVLSASEHIPYFSARSDNRSQPLRFVLSPYFSCFHPVCSSWRKLTGSWLVRLI